MEPYSGLVAVGCSLSTLEPSHSAVATWLLCGLTAQLGTSLRTESGTEASLHRLRRPPSKDSHKMGHCLLRSLLIAETQNKRCGAGNYYSRWWGC